MLFYPISKSLHEAVDFSPLTKLSELPAHLFSNFAELYDYLFDLTEINTLKPVIEEAILTEDSVQRVPLFSTFVAIVDKADSSNLEFRCCFEFEP